MKSISPEIKEKLLEYQKSEITEYHIYLKLADSVMSEENSNILRKIAHDEKRHYEIWKDYTGEDVKPNKLQIFKYFWLARIFGFTFGIKYMERGEKNAQESYGNLLEDLPEFKQIMDEEHEHENALIDLLDEDSLRYIGSIVLGLSDALVELMGALAGFTLALQNTKMIALMGSIIGIAAAMSMGASEYLATKSENTNKRPIKASAYTGTAYIITVLLMIAPYLIFDNYFVCLIVTLGVATSIIAMFNYYVSVAKDEPFKRHFLEMTGLCIGIGLLSFGIGYLMRSVFGIEI